MIKIFIVSIIIMLYGYGLRYGLQNLLKYSYTRYIHPLLARTRSPKYNFKAQSKRKANPREANRSKHRRHLSLV